jgi:hypothetical protein
VEKYGTIEAADLALFKLTDDVDEAVDIILKKYREAGTLWDHPLRGHRRRAPKAPKT